MHRQSQLVATLAVMIIVVSAPYAAAETYTSFVQSVDFDAIGSADEVQNAMDPNSQTNYDTWDPVPSGVWFGGYPVESLLRHTVVPDDDFSIAMATVCMFGPEVIMSGASRTLVRLPVGNDDENYNNTRLSIYEVSRDSNWTFSRMISPVGTCGEVLNDMKVNFTAGTHELIFHSGAYSSTDVSPTDGNDHFSRSGRTYAYVDAPIEPGVFYLFITTAWYDADQYVNIYLQPDTLTDGEWNRSTIATYNEEAPDTYDLQQMNFDESFGYSYDFQNGFGNSAYGLNVWADAEDEFKFFSYVDPATIDGSQYLTFAMPYWATVDNISWEVSIYAVKVAGATSGGLVNLVTWDDYTCRDFILLSMTDDFGTNASVGALTEDFAGWFYIKLTVHNDTRLRIPLWNTDIPDGAPKMNASYSNANYWQGIHDSDENYSYNIGQWIRHDGANGAYNYFWTPQHSVQFNTYQWQRHVPDTGGSAETHEATDMSFGAKILYTMGMVTIFVGDALITMGVPGGGAVRALGVGMQLYARYGDFPDWAGRIWDKLVDVFTEIGQWLWRAAQAIKGAFDYFLELGSMAVGIIILFLAIGLFAFMILITFYSSMALRKAMLGDLRGAGQELAGAASTVGKIAGR